MKIALADVDSHHFPNLCLMKLSTYHKKCGDQVEWWRPDGQYDIAYKSRVFTDTYSKDRYVITNAGQVVCGGTGYGPGPNLPDAVEHCCPDYSIYPQFPDTAYGFLTRGCPRQCPACIVSKKEGTRSVWVSDLAEFWSGQKEIKLMDANLLACRDHETLIMQLAESRALVDFTQGFQKFLDLTNIRNFRKRKVYVLTNFSSTHEQDLYRVETLRRMGYDPYVMVYERPTAPAITRHLQRWVNCKQIFHSVPNFADYLPARKEAH